jgi:hypothetical protein
MPKFKQKSNLYTSYNKSSWLSRYLFVPHAVRDFQHAAAA